MGRSEYRERIKQQGSKKTATTPPPTSADDRKIAKLARITNELRGILNEHIEDYGAFKDEILDVCSDHETRLRRIESHCKLATEATAANEADDSEAETPKKSTSRKADKAESEAEPEVKDYSGDGEVYNGPGYAYLYWSAKYRRWGIKTDLWAAKQAGNGVYEPIWVWYKDGKIDHILSEDEIKKYTP